MEDDLAIQSALIASGSRRPRRVSLCQLAHQGDLKAIKELLNSPLFQSHNNDDNNNSDNNKNSNNFLIDKPDRNGMTALILACKKGHEEVVQTLLEHKASLCPSLSSLTNTPTSSASLLPEPAICCAVGSGSVGTVKLLLAAKALPSTQSKDGQSTLDLAALSANHSTSRDMLKVLLESASSASKQLVDVNLSLTNALLYATQAGHLGSVQLLLENKASCDVLVKETSAWHEAAYGGYQEIIAEFLQRGCAVDLVTSVGMTSLMRAAQNAQDIRPLLRAKASVNVQDAHGNSALHHIAKACCHQKSNHSTYRELVRTLLHAKADSNLRNKDGATASLLTCYPRLVPDIKLLLQLLRLGADPNLCNNKGVAIAKVIGQADSAKAGKAYHVAQLFFIIKLPADLIELVAEYWAPLNEKESNAKRRV